MALIVSPEAEEQIAEIDAWWRRNRPASPTLFVDELAAALDLILVMPKAGRRYRLPGEPGPRRLLLRNTRYHIYYLVSAADTYVLAVWSAVRGEGPELKT